MAGKLQDVKVAMVLTDGFEQVEMTEPREALQREGAEVHLIAPKAGEVRGWQKTDWGERFPVDATLDDAAPEEYDALVLPGGVMNPDHLRRDERVQRFVRHFFEAGKPVGAICHGPWTLIDAGVAKGRELTSFHTLQMDLKNAGARWVDREVVVDRGLVTSRKPDDLPAFVRKLIEELAAERHPAQAERSGGARP